MSDGRLFHARGPATANARSPMVERRVEGTKISADDTERRRRRAVLATGTASSVKYRGAAPVRQRCMSTHSLNFTRSGTRSQWRSTSSGVTWSYLRASADRWAAALTTDCTRSNSRCGIDPPCEQKLLMLCRKHSNWKLYVVVEQRRYRGYWKSSTESNKLSNIT